MNYVVKETFTQSEWEKLLLAVVLKKIQVLEIPIKSNKVHETTRLELQLRTVVAAKALPLMGVG